MITLGSRGFAGPFMAPLWSGARAAGVYAVMAPGWRLLTWRALDFGEAQELSMEAVRRHPKYAEWLRIVGTQWNLYIATHELSFSTEAQRLGVIRELAREYRPEFKPLSSPQEPSLRTLLLAQAMRTSKDT